MKFANAVNVKSDRPLSNKARTTNGMAAKASTLNYCTDLFFKIGASRNRGSLQVLDDFSNAYLENEDIALRIAAWARDVRGGAGERKVFRDIMLWLEQNDRTILYRLLPLVPEIGRWDDLLIFQTKQIKAIASRGLSLVWRHGNRLLRDTMAKFQRIGKR